MTNKIRQCCAVAAFLFFILPVSIFAQEDTTKPSAVRALQRTSLVSDLSPAFMWDEAVDNVGVQAYWVKISGRRAQNIGLDTSYEVDPPLRDGFYILEVWAEDAAGNTGPASSLEFAVGDTVSPSPPAWVERTSAQDDPTPTFTWAAAVDNVGVDHYEIELDGTQASRPYIRFKDVGKVLSYTVPDRNELSGVRAGKLVFKVRAVDAAKNKSVIAQHEFWPPGSFVEAVPRPHALAGRLMKLPDDGNPATFADAAVYYLGRNGRRYVFPDEPTYRSWYAEFSFVQTVSQNELVEYPFGGVVTRHPGARLVKLPTDPKVYAVSRGGVLHHIKNEAVARSLYGEGWPELIDLLDESLFNSYVIGNAIRRSASFNPASERNNTPTIDYDKNLIEE